MDGMIDIDWQRNLPEECPKHHRTVDPYADGRLWVLIDEGCNTPCHSRKWAEDAAMKLKKRGVKMHKLEDTDTMFKGVGKSKGKAKYLIPFAVRFKESKMVLHGTMESFEMEGDSTHLLLFTQQQQAKLGFMKDMKNGVMRSTLFGMQSFEIARHHLSGLYIMAIDHILPGCAENYYTPAQKERLFLSPNQWEGRKREKDDVKSFDRMNKAVAERKSKLEEWGAEDGFAELFMCLNDACFNAEGAEGESDIEEDLDTHMHNVWQKLQRGEVD